MSLLLYGVLVAFVTFPWVPPPSPSDNSIMELLSASSVWPTLVGSLSSTSSTDAHLDNAGVDGVGVDVAEAQDLCAAFFQDWEAEDWVDLSACFSLASTAFL